MKNAYPVSQSPDRIGNDIIRVVCPVRSNQIYCVKDDPQMIGWDFIQQSFRAFRGGNDMPVNRLHGQDDVFFFSKADHRTEAVSKQAESIFAACRIPE